MLGRIPIFAIPVVGLVLIAGSGFFMNKFVVGPKKQTLAQRENEYQQLKQKADQLEQVQAQLEKVKREWIEAHRKLQEIMNKRSIPLSFSMPIAAMFTLAYEYRHDLGPVLTEWILSTGCRIQPGTSISMPDPPDTPPSPPANGFWQIPGPINVPVEGTLEDIERLYKSLDKCPRIVVISGLSLTRVDNETVRAVISLQPYLLCEVPAGAAAAAPAGGGGGAVAGPGMGGFGPSMMGGAAGGPPGMGGPPRMGGGGPGAMQGPPAMGPRGGAGGEEAE